MPPLELLDNFLQLLVAATGSLWSLWLFRKNKQTVFAFLCSGLMCWALGLVFWLLYAFLRGYSPLEPSPANFAWIGSLLCLTSIEQALAGPEEKRWYPPLAFLAPLITIIFAIAWFVEMEYASPWVNTFWCLAFLSLARVSFRGFLYALKHKQRYRAIYHAIVLAMVFFNEMMLHISLFIWPEEYLRFNGYYLFDMLVTLTLGLMTPALLYVVTMEPQPASAV